jgi:hypothetical protein
MEKSHINVIPISDQSLISMNTSLLDSMIKYLLL